MPPRTRRSACLFSSLLILLLVKDSIQSPRRRVLSRTLHSNQLLSSTKEPTQPAQGAQGAQGEQPQPQPHFQDLSPIIRWEEEEEEVVDTKPSTSTSPAETALPRKRKLMWSDRPSTKNSQEPESQPQPHPLRTDVWKLKVRWRQQHFSRQNKKHAAKKEMLLEFADNGYVRLCPPPYTADADTADPVQKSSRATVTASTTTPIGTWKLDPSGLSWHLPLNDGTEHYFFADIHINPFGAYPKMTRGIVIRERRQRGQSPSGKSKSKSPSTWFRPVVATFVGTGVGADTADFSYRHRKNGLYQAEQQTDDR
jgi:hypothetical protein